MIYKKYESIIILNDKLIEDKVNEIKYDYAHFLATMEARPDVIAEVKTDFLGLKKLAYPIKDCESGWYIVFTFWAPEDKIKDLDLIFKTDKNILKFITIVTDDTPMDIDLFPESDESEHAADTTHPVGQENYNYLFGHTDKF